VTSERHLSNNATGYTVEDTQLVRRQEAVTLLGSSQPARVAALMA
jgi:hypothetical protein